MTAIKANLKTEYIIESIKNDVEITVSRYEGKCDNWKTYANMALYQFRTLCLVAFKEKSDFIEAYAELSELTHFGEMFEYPEIASYINSKGEI